MKKAISNILAFVLFMLILLVCFLTIVRTTILSKEYVISKLEEANYYERMSGEITEQFKNYTIQSGLSDNVLKDLFPPEKLKKDINSVINSIYTGIKLEVDTDEIVEKLKENVTAEVETAGLTVNFEDEAMQEYIQSIRNAYESQVSYSTDVINNIGTTIKKIEDLAEKTQAIALGAMLFVVILIGYANTRFKLRILKYTSISIMASGILLLITRFIVELTLKWQNIMIMNQATTNVLQLVLNDVFTKLMIFGAVLFGVGLAISITYNIVKKKI